MLFIRSSFGFVSFLFFYIALRFITLSDSSTIVFSAPVYVSIFACLLIHEPCGVFQIVTVLLTVVGVVLISKPTFLFGDSEVFTIVTNSTLTFDGNEKIVGVVFSFISSLAMALTFIVMRKLQKTSLAVVINHFSVICIVFGIPTLFILRELLDMEITVPSSMSDYWFMLLNSVCGVCGQFMLTFALKIEEAGLVSLARTFDIVAAFVFQIIFLDQPIAITSVIGALIVCIGVAVSCLKKLYDSKPEYFANFPILKNFVKQFNEPKVINGDNQGIGDVINRRPVVKTLSNSKVSEHENIGDGDCENVFVLSYVTKKSSISC